MPPLKSLLLPLLLTSIAAHAAPDEDKLGKAQGYPAGNARTWLFDESVRVDSFTSQGEIAGIFGGTANVLAASDTPMKLPRSAAKAGGTTLGGEADAFWRALVRHYGRW